MEYKVQYDIEGRVLPAQRCCSTLRFGVILLVLLGSLLGGFAAAFIYRRCSGNFNLTEVTLGGDKVETFNSQWTETKLAIVKADVDYLVVYKRGGLVSKPKVQNLAEFGDCIPAKREKLLQTAPLGSVFIMRFYNNSEDQCIFDFLNKIDVFAERISDDDKELLAALYDG